MASAIEQEQAAPAKLEDAEAKHIYPADDTYCATAPACCSSSSPDHGSPRPAIQISDVTCSSNSCAARSSTSCSTVSSISSSATAAVVQAAAAELAALHSHLGLPVLEHAMAGTIEQQQGTAADAQDASTHPAEGTYYATALVSCSSSCPDDGSPGPATQTSDVTCSSNSCTARSSTPCSTVSSAAAALPTAAAAAEPAALHSYPGLSVLEQVMARTIKQQQETTANAQDAEETGSCPAAESSKDTAPVSCSSSCPDYASPRPATQSRNVTRSSSTNNARCNTTRIHPAADSSRDTAPASCSSSCPDHGSPRHGTQKRDLTCSSSNSTPRDDLSTHPAADSSRDTAPASCSSSSPHLASPRTHPHRNNVKCSSRTCTAMNATSCSTINSISSCAAAVVCTAAAKDPAAVYSHPCLPVLEHAMAYTIEQQQGTAASVQDAGETGTHPAEDTCCATALYYCSSSCPDHGNTGPATQIIAIPCTSNGSSARSSTSCSTVSSISSSTIAAEITALHSYPDVPALEQVMTGGFEQQQRTADHVQDADGTRSCPAAEIGSRAAADSSCPTAPVSCSSSSPEYGSPRPATQASDVACSSSISTPRKDITSTHPAADSSGDTVPASCSNSCSDDATPRPDTGNGDVTCNSGISTPGVDITSAHPAANGSRDTAPASCSSSCPDHGPRPLAQSSNVTCSSNGRSTRGGPSCSTVSSNNSSSAAAAGVPTIAESTASTSSYPALDLKRYRVYGDLVCSTCGDTGHVAEECSTCYCSMCCCYGHPTYGCFDACSNCGKIHAEPWGARCNVCRCMLCHLWGHVAATCPSARYNSPRDSSAVASSSSSGSDLAAAAPAAVSISPQDLVPSQIRLQRPTDASEAMLWCRRLLQTLQAAVPAYAAAVGSQPHKLTCLSCVAPNDLAVIIQREYPGHFLDQLYNHYCNATWGSSSSGSAAAPAAVSINPRDLSPSQIRLQRPIKASQARHWRRQLLQTLQAAVPAYAEAVGSQPHKLACLSHVAPDDLAAIMQLERPTDFLDRVYNHYSDSTQWWHQGAGSMLRSNSTVVNQRQQAASTTAGPAPFPAQPPRVTPPSRYQPAQGKVTARPTLAHCAGTVPVTMGSSYAPSSGPFNYHPAADGNSALARPGAAPVPARMGSYYTPVAVPMFPAAPAPVPVYQMMMPEASCATPFTKYQFAFAPQLAPQFTTQLAPHFAPQLVPQFAPQFVPQFAPELAPPLVPQPCLPWPHELMHPAAAAAVPVWPLPQATAAAWQQQQSRQGLTMCNNRTSSSSSMQSSFKQTSMQPPAASAAAAASSCERLTTVSSSSSPSVRRGLRGSSAGLHPRVQCILCGYFGHVADDCKACSICKQHEHTTEDCTRFPAAAEEVNAATAAVALVVASWQQPRTAAAATCPLPAAATTVTTAGSVIASWQPPRTAAAATAPAHPPPAATAAAAVASVTASWQSPPPAAAAACPPPAAAAAVPLPLLSPAQAPLPQTAAAAATAVAAAPLTTAAKQAVSNPAVAAMGEPAAEAARAAAAAPPPPSQVATHRRRPNDCLEHVNASTECGQLQYEGHERLGQLVKAADTSCKDASMQSTNSTAAAAAAGYVRAAKAAAARAAAAIALLQLPLPAAAAPCPPPAAATTALPPLLSSSALAPPSQAAATTAASLTACAAEPPPPPQRHWADQKGGDAGRWDVPPPPPPQLRPPPPQPPPPPSAPASAAATTATPPTLAASHPPLMPVAAAATDYLTPLPAPVQCAVQAAASSLGDEYQLQPESANPEELKNMIAVLIQRLFVAAKSAYALDLLQQQQQGKLHCLARLSAADLDNILARNESLELLDAVHDKHSQRQRYSKHSGDQELLPEQDFDRVHVQQQQPPASDPWQQPLMESSQKHAVQKGDVPTTSHSTVFSREQRQKLDVFDRWQPPQQQQTDLSQQQDSTSQPEQSQLPKRDFASGSSDRPESVMVDDSLYFKSSSDSESEDLDLLLVMPAVAAPAHLQQATRQVELTSESALVGQCTTPAEVAAGSHDNPGDGGVAASPEADVDSDESDIADMLTMLMCR